MSVPEIRHRRVQAGGVGLHCAEAGDPKSPLVLLLHGFPESWITWRFQLPALAEAGFFAVAPDLRGYGGSDKPRGVDKYKLQPLAGDVAALIEAYGREKPHVVGHDWGAYVAWHAAMWHPAHVEKLAILNVPHPEKMLRGLRRLEQIRKSWYVFAFQLPVLPERGLAADDFAKLRKLFRYTPRAPYPDEVVAQILDGFRKPYARTAAIHYYRAAWRSSPRREIIRCPTLVIWGDQDRWLSPELAEPDPRWVIDCRVEHLPEATHWVQADDPARVNDLLVGFLK